MDGFTFELCHGRGDKPPRREAFVVSNMDKWQQRIKQEPGGWRDGGIDAPACALKPLHVPHLSCSETGAVIVVITLGPLGGLMWKLCNTRLQFVLFTLGSHR